MTLWRGEVHVGASASLQGASAADTFAAAQSGASYAFTCYDQDTQLFVKLSIIHSWDFEAGYALGTKFYFSRMSAGSYQSVSGPLLTPDPYQTSFSSSGQFFVDLPDSGSAFGVGGVLAIEKDTVTGRLSFITPAGRWDTTTAVLGLSMTTPIRPFSTGLYLQDQSPAAGPMLAESVTANWSNIKGLKDGVKITGAAISAADPGSWNAWAESGLFFAFAHQTFTQNTGDYQSQIDIDAGNNGPDGWYRQWTGPDVFPVGTGIDMEKSSEHGVLYRAMPDWALPRQMDFERSFDNGHTWSSPVVVADDPTWNNTSPSLNSVDGRLYLCWHNGTNILESRSLDGGANWSMPVIIPFTGTNPRRIADKSGGGSYYFFVDGSGNIKVAVTYDNGASFRGPYTVATGVGAQQIDAEFAPDSSIVVSYIDSGTWTQKRSRDMGQNWS